MFPLTYTIMHNDLTLMQMLSALIVGTIIGLIIMIIIMKGVK